MKLYEHLTSMQGKIPTNNDHMREQGLTCSPDIGPEQNCEGWAEKLKQAAMPLHSVRSSGGWGEILEEKVCCKILLEEVSDAKN